jgi:hypothetical protein
MPRVIEKLLVSTMMTVPYIRRCSAGPSWRRFGFDPRPVRVGFVVDKVTLPQDFFLKALQVSPVSIVQPLLHAHSFVTEEV